MTDNFFVVPWTPKRYQNGLHYITVTVVDNDGRENQVTQPFRMDEEQSLKFDVLATLVLRCDATVISKILFWFSWTLCIAPLIFLRILHELVKCLIFILIFFLLFFLRSVHLIEIDTNFWIKIFKKKSSRYTKTKA